MADSTSPQGESESRNVMTYQEYSRGLINLLTRFKAPDDVIEGVISMDQWITIDISYKAPEAQNTARDNIRLFNTFCNLDKSPSTSRHEWQNQARDFFEKKWLKLRYNHVGRFP
jgi:hypothetical protein